VKGTLMVKLSKRGIKKHVFLDSRVITTAKEGF